MKQYLSFFKTNTHYPLNPNRSHLSDRSTMFQILGVEENQSVEEDVQSQEDSGSSSSTITADVVEDATSSPSPTCSPPSVNQQPEPIKKGLSRYYGGKSQSFTSLESVKSLEDLPKKENPYNINIRMKLSRSYADGLNSHRFCTPKHTISKRTMSSRPSFLSTMVDSRNDLLSTCNRPPIPIQK